MRLIVILLCIFFFSSRRRHTRCALVTGVQTCALPILARRCTFNLREVKYDYPAELVPKGETPASHLRKLTETGMRRRWPEGAPAQVVKQIEDELALIAELGYEAFFLTVEAIVRFANERKILCQGRGSSATSAALGRAPSREKGC